MGRLAKYYHAFGVMLAETFAWKLNFVMWRVRTILAFLMLYFLWSTVFTTNTNVLGYDRPQILTYVFLIALFRSFVLAARNTDVAGEIRDGGLTNFLIRPVSYFGWWWARDLADRLVNIGFVAVELPILFLLLKPPIIFQTNLFLLAATVVSVILAIILFFHLSFLISSAAFWVAEVWGIRFVTIIMLEFLAGGLFPLDILPQPIFQGIMLTPFPYILFFPVKVYLGSLSYFEIIRGMGILLVWTLVLIILLRFVWDRGLRGYAGEGR